MKFRLKITLCMIWLLSISFGIGGSLMIGSSFRLGAFSGKGRCRGLISFSYPYDRNGKQHKHIAEHLGYCRQYSRQMDGMGMTNFCGAPSADPAA